MTMRNANLLAYRDAWKQQRSERNDVASFNKVILMGNLTRDPQVKQASSGTACTEIGLSISRRWFDKGTNRRRDETTFVDVTLWGRDAETAGQYLAKGKPVLIEGRLQLDSWDDKQTGQKRSKLRVVGERLQLLRQRGDGGGVGRDSASSVRSDGPPQDEVPFF